MIAEADAKKGFNIAKRAGVAQAVLDDAKVHPYYPTLVAVFTSCFSHCLTPCRQISPVPKETMI